MQRLEEGYAGYLNPFGNTVHQVSLLPEDVVCFVFWSKNFTPFMEELKEIQSRGYHFYFNYTITGLSSYFEKNVLGIQSVVKLCCKSNHIEYGICLILNIIYPTDYLFDSILIAVASLQAVSVIVFIINFDLKH